MLIYLHNDDSFVSISSNLNLSQSENCFPWKWELIRTKMLNYVHVENNKMELYLISQISG